MREFEFKIDDWIFLKVPTMKGVMHFCNKERLSAQFICPCRITNKIEKGAYVLTLPFELAYVLSLFHISMLKK